MQEKEYDRRRKSTRSKGSLGGAHGRGALTQGQEQLIPANQSSETNISDVPYEPFSDLWIVRNI
jgi:hypothetical protein